jgi:mono/diheme cytochrome c family protein
MTAKSSVGWLASLVLAIVVAHSTVLGEREQAPRPVTPADAITYTKHIAPIVQRSCQSCHRPGTNAPMSLMTYEDVRPWARAIKTRVMNRIMPPWHIERNVGIQQFKDDPSLSDAEIATIAAWSDAGAPRGNPADLPPPAVFPNDEEWHIGTPDLVVQIPKDHVVPADGGDLWIDYIADSGLTEDRYLQAVEAKPGPGARAVVHHLLTYLIQEVDEDEVLSGRLDDRGTNSESFLNEYAVGKNGDILPEGTAKLVKAGARIRFNLHYHASGTTTVDRTRIGLKFYPKGYVPKYHQISLQIANSHDVLDIPPNTISRHDGYYRFAKPARVTAIQPHMHNRGKRMCVEAILPNGRAEMLNCMGFEFNWHKVYNYADEATPLLPAGTMLHTILWHDNTAGNRSNPDPRNWVGYGQRTIDEMAFAWVTWTYLDENDYKSMVAERAKRRTTERER